MDWKELLAQAKAKIEEAKVLAQRVQDGEGEEGDKERVDALIAEAKDLRARAEQYKDIAEVGAVLVEEVKATQEAEEKAQQEADLKAAEFASFGDFLVATYRFSKFRDADPRLTWFDEERGREGKALAEGIGATGGFLVPTEFRAQLLAVAAERAIVRPRATIIPMSRRSVQIPVLDQTSTTSGVSHFFGGVRVYWTEEAGEKTETSPTFKQRELVAHKLAAITYCSDELLADSAITLQAFLTGPMGLSGAIADEEDYAFLRGTGAGQPLGVITAVNAPTLVVNRNAAGAFGFVDAVAMLESFLPGSRGVWVMNQTVMDQVFRMVDPLGQYIWLPNAAQAGPGTLLGYPIVFTEKLPTLGTQGDVLLADFSYYLLGDRQLTTVDSSIHNRYEYDQTTWRAVHRVDGMPWMLAPVTLRDGSTQVSPFVILGDVVGS